MNIIIAILIAINFFLILFDYFFYRSHKKKIDSLKDRNKLLEEKLQEFDDVRDEQRSSIYNLKLQLEKSDNQNKVLEKDIGILKVQIEHLEKINHDLKLKLSYNDIDIKHYLSEITRNVQYIEKSIKNEKK